MFNRILAALVAAFTLAACEDVPNQVDPTCTVDCEVDTGEDTDDPAVVTVPFAARTTIDGADEPCMVRYESRDSAHTETKASGTTVQLRAGETYDLFVGTFDGLHTRYDGVRFTSRPTVAEPVNDPTAAPQTTSIALDPFFEGWFTCFETHNQSGNIDDFQTLEVQTTWLEWEYEGEWDQMVEAAGNCLDFGNAGLYCFDGANTVIQYSYSGQFVERSKANSVSLENNKFSYISENGSYTTTCEAH